MSRDVFISYKTEDRESAERLCAVLERETISCWLAPRDIAPGREWAAAIVDGLQQSKHFVLLLSSHSIAAKQIAREAQLADQQNLPIFTFRLEDIQPPNELLYFLGNIQWLDAFNNQFESAAARLAAAIRQQGTPTAPHSAPLPSPARKKPSYLLPIAAALVVLIALSAWLIFRKSPAGDAKTVSSQPDPTAEIQQIQIVADRFLTERDSENYDAAWNEYALPFQKHVDRSAWQREIADRNRAHGGIPEHKFQSCRPSNDQTNVYYCDYTMLFKDGARFDDEMRMVKTKSGNWIVDNGKITAASK